MRLPFAQICDLLMSQNMFGLNISFINQSKNFTRRKKDLFFCQLHLFKMQFPVSTGKAIKKPTIKEIAVHFIKALFYCTDILHIK